MKTAFPKVLLWVCLALLGVLAVYLYPTLYPARRPDRPLAGDQVQPEITVPEAWKAGDTGRLELCLKVWGRADADQLNDTEVPNEVLPVVRVRFYRGEEELPGPFPCRVERMC